MATENLDQYGLPTRTYDSTFTSDSAPYDQSAYLEQGAADYLKQYAPALPAFPERAAVPTGAAAPASSNKTQWQLQLEGLLESTNGKPTPDQFDKLAEDFKTRAKPVLFGRKLSEAGVDAALADFDRQAAEDRARLFAVGVPEGMSAELPGMTANEVEASKSRTMLRENLATFAAGVGGLVPKTLGLLDLVARDANGLIDSLRHNMSLAGDVLQGDRSLGDAVARAKTSYSLGDRTFLGDMAETGNAMADEFVKENTSYETLVQQRKIGASLGADASIIETLGGYLSNPRTAAMMISGGLSSLVPIGMTAKVLSKAAAFQKASSTAKALGAAGPSSVVWAAASVHDYENYIKNTDYDKLLQENPKFRAFDELVKSDPILNTLSPDQRQETVRRKMFEQGAVNVFGTSLAANLGTLAIPGLRTAEAAVAGAASRTGTGVLRAGDRARGFVGEATQEGIAGAIEGTGRNVALGQDTFEGSGRGFAEGALAGGPIGALVVGGDQPSVGRAALGFGTRGATTDQNKPLDQKLKRKGAAATTAQTGAQGAPTGAATPTAQTGQTADTAATASGYAPDEAVTTDPAAAGLPQAAVLVVANDFAQKLTALEARYKKSPLKSADTILRAAETAAKNNNKASWGKLSLPQRVALVEQAVDTIVKHNPKVEGVGELVTEYKNLLLGTAPTPAVIETGDSAVAAPVVAATAPVAAAAPDTIAPAPAQTPAPQKAVPVEAKGKSPSDQRLRKQTAQGQSQNDAAYAKAMWNYINDNRVAVPGPLMEIVQRDSRLEAARAELGKSITNEQTLRTFLENGVDTAPTPAPAQTPEQVETAAAKVRQDNRRTVGSILKGAKKADRPLKKEVKEILASLSGTLAPSEYEKMTVGELRARREKASSSRPAEAPKLPKTRRKKSAEKPKTLVQTTDTPQRTGIDDTFEDARISALQSREPRKGKDVRLRRAKEKAQTMLSNIEAERAKNTKGIPAASKLQDMTLKQLEKFHDDLIYERSRSESTAKNIEVVQEVGQTPAITQGLSLISDLTSDTKQKITDTALTTAQANSLQELFLDGLKTGKFSPVQEALVAAGAYKPHVDAVIKKGKEAYAEELSRFEFTDAEGKPISRQKKAKMLTAYRDYVDGNLSKTKFRSAIQEITRDETGKGPEVALFAAAEREQKAREKPKSTEPGREQREAANERIDEGTKRPKGKAPLAKGAKRKQTSSNVKSSLTVSQQLRNLFPEAQTSTITNLTAAVELAQQGDTSALSEAISNAVTVEEVPADKAKDIRALAQQEYVAPVGMLRQQIDEVLEEAEATDPDDDILELESRTPVDVADNMDLRLAVEELTESTLEDGPGTSQSADSLFDEETSPEAVVDLITPEIQSGRGPDAVLKWLRSLRADRRMRPTVDFAVWLIEQNPNLARDLRIQIGDRSSVGAYSPLLRLVEINETKARDVPRAIVHEILHHTERMLPRSLQVKVRIEYAARLKNKMKQALRNGDTAGVRYLRDVETYLKNPTQGNRAAAVSHILQDRVDQSYYRYLNASEYFAETASDILARKHGDDSWIGQLKEWLREMFEHFRAAVGWDSEHMVYQALQNVLNSSGAQLSSMQLRGGTAVAAIDELQVADTAEEEDSEDDPYLKSAEDVKAEKAAQAKALKERHDRDTNVSAFQRIWERLVDASHAFEKIEDAVYRNDGELNEDNSVTAASSRYHGVSAWNNKVDRADVFEPVRQQIERIWPDYAYSQSDFIEALDRFFGNTNFLERIKTDWIMSVPLKSGREVDRQEVMEQFQAGEITPTEARLQLSSLATKYAKKDMREHALDSGISEGTFDAIQKTLDSLADAGIDTNSMAELNGLLNDVRTRLRDRLVEAGFFTADDKWTEFYGWEWYVPLKGSNTEATDAASQAAFDMIPQNRLALAKLSKQMEAMEGRKTFGEAPFQRLFVDLARAGERSAHTQHLMQSVYNLVVDNPDLAKKITVYEGNPRDGYIDINEVLEDGQEPTLYRSIPKRQDSAIYNDGNRHYAIRFPKDSQLLRGLVVSNSVLRPPETYKKYVGTPTNIMARAYTTLSPFWQTAVGFVRDLTTIPASIAVENFDNPLQASKFLTNYAIEVPKLLAAAPTFYASLKGDINKLREMAAENPGSYADWLIRWQQAGGANDFSQGFTLDDVSDMFKGDFDPEHNIITASYKALNKYTGNYANFLEQLGRVAAFKALTEGEGLSDKDAANKVRRVLDYQKTGTWGRNINTMLAFYRVSATGVDSLRRMFRKQGGGIDAKKLGFWMGTMGAVGYIAYGLASAQMGDDEDGKKKMHKIRLDTLTQKAVLPVGDEIVGVNIGLGIPQLLMAPGVLLAAVNDGHATMEEAALAMYNTIIRNGPVRIAGMKEHTPTNFLAATYSGITPTVIQPLATLADNVDVFGRPIHTEHPREDLARADQGRASTAPEYKEFARWMADNTNGLVDYYPEDWRYLASNYGGQNVSDLFKMVADIDAKKAIGLDNAEYNPVTSRFEIKDLDYYDQENMYDAQEEAGEALQAYNAIKVRHLDAGGSEEEAKKLQADYLKANPQIAKVQAAVKGVKKVQTNRNEEIRRLSRDRLLSEGRKQVLRKEQDKKMREATTTLQKALEDLE